MRLDDPFTRHPRTLAGLPRLVRVYILHCLIGFGISAIFTGLVVLYNIAGIGHLVTAVQGGPRALFVFFFLNGIVFSGVQFGVFMMLLDRDEP
ncbi:hypothetical protein [Oceanibium sediminis]|uniref:hypothetical protein n=1 Tax=Oceanibium sediminis TaxID=2026339 RepID=UPI000DD4840A|nr:hypothetical protein [Oceanibium sediminis]